jgi:hypothetical protein
MQIDVIPGKCGELLVAEEVVDEDFVPLANDTK